MLYSFFVLRHFSKVAIIYCVKMSVIVGQLLDRGGIVIFNLVIRFIFVYTRENFCLKCECWSVKKYQHCRLIWKLCIVCEAVLKKAIARMLTETILLFMITLIWKRNYRIKVLPRYYHIYIYIQVYVDMLYKCTLIYLFVSFFIHIYIYIYIYIYTHIYIYIFIYIPYK